MYVELRARYGVSWTERVAHAIGRQSQDAAFVHMESADTQNPLAYLDYSQLLAVIADDWDLFAGALTERRSWDGRQEDLKRVRHRMGHMRVPHSDDLARLEQTLRDLERGAFIAYASYNRRFWPEGGDDLVTRDWVEHEHPDAQRLVRHAERNYDTKLILRWSRRPWGARQGAIHAPGRLWHADFVMRGRALDPAALWRDSAMNAVRPLLVHLLADDPWSIGLTFSAADSSEAISDAIGAAFDAVLMTSRETTPDDVGVGPWSQGWGAVDFRLKHRSGWSIVDETTVPITSFGAGGGVAISPDW